MKQTCRRLFQKSHFVYIFAYMARKYIFTITKDNKVLSIKDSARSLSEEMRYLGKSHVWYSRKLSNADSFLFVFNNEIYNVQKHLNKL